MMKELPSKFVHFCLSAGYKRKLSRLLDNELSPAKAAALRTHLDVCAGCRHQYEDLRFAKDAVADFEIPGGVPSYAEFQERTFELQLQETRTSRPIRSAATLRLKFATNLLAAIALGLLIFRLGVSYGSPADTVLPVYLAEQRFISLPPQILTAPANSSLEIKVKNNNTFSPRPTPPTHIPNTEQLWEQIAQNQQVNLQDAPPPKRGDLEQSKYDEPPLFIVMSKAHYTGIRLELPQDCEKGKYLLSLEAMDGKSLPITAEEESRDGTELTVNLDLRGLTEGKYFLLVERENEEQREYIGHFKVRIVDPTRDAK